MNCRVALRSRMPWMADAATGKARCMRKTRRDKACPRRRRGASSSLMISACASFTLPSSKSPFFLLCMHFFFFFNFVKEKMGFKDPWRMLRGEEGWIQIEGMIYGRYSKNLRIERLNNSSFLGIF